MKRMVVFLAVLVATLTTLPSGTLAETRVLYPSEEFHKTFILSDDDIISWDWTVTSGGDVDFWIEDLFGTKYNELHDVQASKDEFEVPEGGIWVVHMYNDDVDMVTLEYEFSTGSKVAEDIFMAFLLPIIIGVIVLVVIVVTVLLLMLKKKPAKPPQYPPQQPGSPPQQPPGQYPPQRPPPQPPTQP